MRCFLLWMVAMHRLNNLRQNSRQQATYLLKALRVIWQASPLMMVIWAVLLIMNSVLPLINIALTDDIINAVTQVIDSASADAWQTLLQIGGVLLIVTISQQIAMNFSAWHATAHKQIVSDHITSLLHAKINTLDISVFEVGHYYDLMHLATSYGREYPFQLVQMVGQIVRSVITLMGLLVILMSYAWWLPLVIVLSAIPSIINTGLYSVRYRRWRVDHAEQERRAAYYNNILFRPEPAPEIRLFQLGTHYSRLYQDLRTHLRTGQLRLERQRALGSLLASTSALIVTGVVAVYMLAGAVGGALTLGDLALFYRIFSQGRDVMRSLFNYVAYIYNNSLFIGHLYDFLDLETRIEEPEQPQPFPERIQHGIRFEDVTFRYPGSHRAVFESLSFTLAAGKITALIGENGQGKTTLTKLLCRFYDPDSGRILIDDVDIRQMSSMSLQQQITVLFQVPTRFSESASTNIAFGDYHSHPSPSKIERAAQAAGADSIVQRLENGYETMLSKAFSGTDLSVGEWQRVALARAFLRDAPIVILDEPTSAMDPWAEMDWSKRFRQAAAGRTTLIVTHRFTTAMHADIIYMLDNSHIIEAGTHEELIAQGGRYATLWREQMDDYFRHVEAPPHNDATKTTSE